MTPETLLSFALKHNFKMMSQASIEWLLEITKRFE